MVFSLKTEAESKLPKQLKKEKIRNSIRYTRFSPRTINNQLGVKLVGVGGNQLTLNPTTTYKVAGSTFLFTICNVVNFAFESCNKLFPEFSIILHF